MTPQELKTIINKSGLTYKQFALRINEYCQEEIIPEDNAHYQIANYVHKRKMHNALAWIIKQVFK